MTHNIGTIKVQDKEVAVKGLGSAAFTATTEYEKAGDFRLYYYQPVEIDARNFADDVMKKLEEKGVL